MSRTVERLKFINKALVEALELMLDNEPLTALPRDERVSITNKAELALRLAADEERGFTDAQLKQHLYGDLR